MFEHLTGYRVAIFLAFGLILILVGGVVLIKRLWSPDYYSQRILAANIMLDDSWQELTPDPVLKIEKDKIYIEIGVSSPYKAFSAWGGIADPDGGLIKLEVKGIDNMKREYEFTYAGNRRKGRLEYADYELKSSDRPSEMKSIMIRANQRIRVSEVIFSGFDLKDMP